MAENKTRETGASVTTFLDGVEPEARREDAKRLAAMLESVSGTPPRMWGPSIVGFGSYRYRYESGREGAMCRIGFSPRRNALVLYILGGFPGHQALLDRLGKFTTGASCLYVRKLADIDMAVLETLARESLAHMAAEYPPDPQPR